MQDAPQHPLADIMNAITGVRSTVDALRTEIRDQVFRTGKLEERVEISERAADRALTAAMGTDRRVAALESRSDDLSLAIQKHVAACDKQAESFVWAKKWLAALVVGSVLLSAALGGVVVAALR